MAGAHARVHARAHVLEVAVNRMSRKGIAISCAWGSESKIVPIVMTKTNEASSTRPGEKETILWSVIKWSFVW